MGIQYSEGVNFIVLAAQTALSQTTTSQISICRGTQSMVYVDHVYFETNFYKNILKNKFYPDQPKMFCDSIQHLVLDIRN